MIRYDSVEFLSVKFKKCFKNSSYKFKKVLHASSIFKKLFLFKGVASNNSLNF